MEDETSRNSDSSRPDEDVEDFVEDEHEEDDEATLDEEEALLENDEEELDDLNEEAEIDIEELRRRYGYGAPVTEESDTEVAGSSGQDEDEKVTEEALELARDNYFADDGVDEDGDYKPPDDEKKEVRIDPVKYQATVPESMVDGEVEEGHFATLLWSPREDLDNKTLNVFLHDWASRKYGVPKDESKIETRDDEDALFALLSASFSTEAATASFPFQPANECRITKVPPITPWSDSECDAFEAGMKAHGKNFRLVHDHYLLDRTLGELIEYYYHWKKTARYNAFQASRRPAHRANHGDFMAEVMQQMDKGPKHNTTHLQQQHHHSQPHGVPVPSTVDLHEGDGDGTVTHQQQWWTTNPNPIQEQSTESV